MSGSRLVCVLLVLAANGWSQTEPRATIDRGLFDEIVTAAHARADLVRRMVVEAHVVDESWAYGDQRPSSGYQRREVCVVGRARFPERYLSMTGTYEQQGMDPRLEGQRPFDQEVLWRGGRMITLDHAVGWRDIDERAPAEQANSEFPGIEELVCHTGSSLLERYEERRLLVCRVKRDDPNYVEVRLDAPVWPIEVELEFRNDAGLFPVRRRTFTGTGERRRAIVDVTVAIDRIDGRWRPTSSVLEGRGTYDGKFCLSKRRKVRFESIRFPAEIDIPDDVPTRVPPTPMTMITRTTASGQSEIEVVDETGRVVESNTPETSKVSARETVLDERLRAGHELLRRSKSSSAPPVKRAPWLASWATPLTWAFWFGAAIPVWFGWRRSRPSRLRVAICSSLAILSLVAAFFVHAHARDQRDAIAAWSSPFLDEGDGAATERACGPEALYILLRHDAVQNDGIDANREADRATDIELDSDYAEVRRTTPHNRTRGTSLRGLAIAARSFGVETVVERDADKAFPAEPSILHIGRDGHFVVRLGEARGVRGASVVVDPVRSPLLIDDDTLRTAWSGWSLRAKPAARER